MSRLQKSSTSALASLIGATLLSLPLVAHAKSTIPRIWDTLGSSKYTKLREQIPACVTFHQKLMLDGLAKKEGAFNTDQMMVYRKGKVVYEVADGFHQMDTLHSMWSSSKSVTATLIGAAAKKGWLSVDDKLSKYYSQSKYRSHLANDPNESKFKDIKLQNLLEMDSNFIWDESYESDPKTSTFLPMLYGAGSPDMLKYALAQPMAQFGPGNRWNYSGGNSMMLMGILAQLAPKNGSSAAGFVDDLLFKPLGITKGFIEADTQGHYIGNSYVYFTPEEMLRVGMLYLQNGQWEGKQILDKDWIQETQKLSSGMTRLKEVAAFGKETLDKFKANIIEEGAYSRRAFWLNQPVPGVMDRQFKNSPTDLYFTAGHYGQLIWVIPSLEMVIVRTAHDKFYWNNIDAMVSSAVACFNDKRWNDVL